LVAAAKVQRGDVYLVNLNPTRGGEIRKTRPCVIGWVREKFRRENVSYLPPTLAIRKELEDALGRVARADSETAVRSIVTAINQRIVQINSRPTSGPPSSVMQLDVETVLRKWRAAREA
jgi:hypothetical protein